MGRKSTLTESEKASILAYRDSGASVNKISAKIGRSRCVVQNFLRDPVNYGKKISKTGNRKTSNRDRRNILRCASDSGSISSKIKAECDVPITPRQVRNILSGTQHLNWQKLAAAPKQKTHHITKRINYATK